MAEEEKLPEEEQPQQTQSEGTPPVEDIAAEVEPLEEEELEAFDAAPSGAASKASPLGDDEEAGVAEAMRAWEEGRHQDEGFDYEDEVLPIRFAPLDEDAPVRPTTSHEELNNVEVEISVELGRIEMTVRELLEVKEQKILELDKLAGESFDIRVNQRLFAEGEIVVMTEAMAVRITRLFDGSGDSFKDKD